MILALRIAGVLLILLGAIHAGFPKRFGWKEELPRLSPINRQMFQVHAFFIALVLVLMGAASAVFPEALVNSGTLSRVVLAGAGVFWSCRLAIQFFVYDAKLWRGRPFELGIHVLFSLFWFYLVAVYAWALWTAWFHRGV